MFAKLKKKIQEEGGPDGERSFGPGLASPVKRESLGSGLFGPGRKETPVKDGRDSDAASISSQESVSASSKEQVLSMLMKRTDQVKKMEAKISDLAALIKEKNRMVEKLETTLEKQQDSSSQRLQELTSQHSREKAEMEENFTLTISEKEEELNERLVALQKVQSELKSCQAQIQAQEAQLSQKQGAVGKETSKLKHLLSTTQTQFQKAEEKCTRQAAELDMAQKRIKEVEKQIRSLNDKLESAKQRSASFEEGSQRHQHQVEELASQKVKLTARVEELQTQLSQKSSQLSGVQEELTDLQDQHMTLQRNSDLHRQKMNGMLSEKDDKICHLQEKVVSYEQRMKDSGLSEDERVKALEAERDLLEKKLDETRQQLTEIKTTWSDKISHLEHQIAHLNNKIVEDNEDLAHSRKQLETAKQDFQKQLGEMQKKLDASQKQATLNFEMAHEKDTLMDKQKEAMELELMSVRGKVSDLEAELATKADEFQKKLIKLQRSKEEEKQTAQVKIAELERSQEECLEKEIDHEKQITKMEDDFLKAKAELSQRQKDVSRLNNELSNKTKDLANIRQQLSNVEEQLRQAKCDSDSQYKSHTGLRAEVLQYKKEIEDLTNKNNELSNEMHSTSKKAKQKEDSLRKDLQSRETAISGLEQCIQDMQHDITELQAKVASLKDEAERAKNELESAEVDRLKSELSGLEDQLTDRNKTIKMQQQRLSDLKKTLQREFKIQSLPNDEPMENNHTNDRVPEPHQPPHLALYKQSRTSADPHARLPRAASLTGLNNSRALDKLSIGGSTSDTLKGLRGLEELDDVNFEYLKHVVLKFMLSRESEALQLIKAVSTLLRLSREEERVVQETLEWKMSWFASRRPAVGKGQTAKIIPPSY